MLNVDNKILFIITYVYVCFQSLIYKSYLIISYLIVA